MCKSLKRNNVLFELCNPMMKTLTLSTFVYINTVVVGDGIHVLQNILFLLSQRCYKYFNFTIYVHQGVWDFLISNS